MIHATLILAGYTNCLFMVLCITLRILTGDPSWMLVETQGPLPYTLAIITWTWAKR